MKKLALFAAATICALALSGCMMNQGIYTTISYDHPERYSIGPGQVTETVNQLDIQWIAGPVELRYGDGEELSFIEAANGALTDQTTMRWWLDGDTLRLRFCDSGKVRLGNLQKSLTVTLPAGLFLKDADISNVSGAIDVPELHVREAKLTSTSGAISACVSEAEQIRAASVSGSVKLTVSGAAEKVSAASTSGRLELTVDTVDDLTVDTVSGSVAITARRVSDGEIGTTSGSADVSLADASGEWEIGTVSGSVELTIPEDSNLTLEYSTVSGSSSWDIPITQEGKNRFTSGRGDHLWKVKTTSGSLEVHKRT